MTDPTGERLMTIGDVARASGLSAKALRLYDDSGLLVPVDVDPVTGYRRYAVDQLDRARLVARLRLAGVPLARIRVVADLVERAPRAAAAELTSYWRQVEADTASAGALVADVVAALSTEEHPMTPTHGTTSLTHPRAAARDGIGARRTQEDAVLVGDGVYAVADGIGEAADGLSAVVVARLAEVERTGDPVAALDAAVTAAAALVAERYADRPGAGCTLTAVVVTGDQAVLAHVGDSRAHLVRDGRLERLTRDHTVVQTLVDEGRLTAEEARLDERRVQLNRAIAVDGAYQPDLGVHALRPGDRVVLTTDGVHGRLAPAVLADLLVAGTGPDEVAAAVEAAVLEAGADDNYAVVVVDV
ncbi:MerR family transcriptional regulator [Nocardioides dongxiaopingii]|uniref:MerR family transcriptional regulator n=1 Tax=Nocardioides dongxiaopingii TaxID=2576036 RepID=UPI0010C7664F|nr:MerR family transcriptional regulator [Nocardioides dongxiaopingii]